MDSLNKMKLGVLLNNITGGMAVSQSQPAVGTGSIKLSGLGQIGLGGSSNNNTNRSSNPLAASQGFMTSQQHQNQILASHLISSAQETQAQPFFLNQHQQPFSSLKRPREDSSSWLMHQVTHNNNNAANPMGLVAHPNGSTSSANTQQQDDGAGGEKNTSRRRTVHQLEVLESVFKLCPNPTEARRKQLGQMLKMDERQVVIWFQNKRQRVRAKMKEQENNTLRQQHTALKTELDREKSRERALEQENALLKNCMDEKVKKMEELRQASSELLVEYYKKKGGNLSEWKDHLPSGLMEALKLPNQKEGLTEELEAPKKKIKTTTTETDSDKPAASGEKSTTTTTSGPQDPSGAKADEAAVVAAAAAEDTEQEDDVQLKTPQESSLEKQDQAKTNKDEESQQKAQQQ